MRTANLVTARKAEAAAQEKRKQLVAEEKRQEMHAVVRSSHDEERLHRQERFLRDASRETTRAGSRVGTKQYFDRFKK
jgi:hypothetical protein